MSSDGKSFRLVRPCVRVVWLLPGVGAQNMVPAFSRFPFCPLSFPFSLLGRRAFPAPFPPLRCPTPQTSYQISIYISLVTSDSQITSQIQESQHNDRCRCLRIWLNINMLNVINSNAMRNTRTDQAVLKPMMRNSHHSNKTPSK